MSRHQTSTDSPAKPAETGSRLTDLTFNPPSKWTAEEWDSAKRLSELDEGKVLVYFSTPDASAPAGTVRVTFEGGALPGPSRRLDAVKGLTLTEGFLKSMADGKFQSRFRGDADPTFKDSVVSSFVQACMDPRMAMPRHVKLLPMSQFKKDEIELVRPTVPHKDASVGGSLPTEVVTDYWNMLNFLKSRVEEELDKTYSPPETVGPRPPM